MTPIPVVQLAAFLGAEWNGDPDLVITGVAPLAEAGATELSFLADPRFAAEARSSEAGAILARPGTPDVPSARCLGVPDPGAAMYRSVMLLHPPTALESFLSPQTIVASTAKVDKSAYVGAFVTIGNGTAIGERAVIRDGVRIGEEVHVGAGAVIEENAVIHDRVQIGDRVRIGPGTVIGSVGFGFVAVDGQQKRFPHVGTVVIEDDVEIGANCTVDRGTLGTTRIGRGSKLDNLIHVGHNVQIGKGVFVAAQCGFSGSSRIGDGVQMGGQAGVAGHISIAAGTRIGAKSGVMKSASGSIAGHPARQLIQQRRAETHLMHLEELVSRVSALEKALSGRPGKNHLED
ncbi:MAG TPA: UDP-3-O-(3-hydroxymyristoyl)glucosamine N-acyltransferase [Candidatus Latescibacteria bacterium]|nr:MAG: UDP-3-O-acylglucosamine N-acyltransferase [Candidatus Latescibacteria bacterium ADurb.Bin168]HPU85299.1 UDP-3-O-(3-hydroxymyristoyl)glucosamine N-acyltransferase [Candidatus Latescibacterota bacterium]